ncbi:MAG: lytic transglycosylase domain-containing protein, partial [Campylobacteraceae bacterium]
LLRVVVLGKTDLEEFPKSLLYMPNANNSLSHEAAFLLGLNAIKQNNTKLAGQFFVIAQTKAYYQSDKDKSLFWQFLATKDINALQKVAGSQDINIYSLYAKEELNATVENIELLTQKSKKKVKFDMQDPFAWANLLDKIKDSNETELQKIADTYNTKDTLPVYAFIKERQAKYKQGYYITPYSEYLKDVNTTRKILIYSIARQESRFIPSAISTSYALGMMQFMPFLARDTAKQLKLKDFDIDYMFKPEIAYSFANHHLDYLEKYLNHPLFVSYAYNGGIGFTRRMLESGLFKKGDFEPFLSMELVAYNESREYGKKVMANYIVYSKLLGEKVSIKNLFEELVQP